MSKGRVRVWSKSSVTDHRILVRAEVQGNKAKRDEWIPMHARLEPALRVLDPSTNFVFAFDWTSETVGRRFKELAVGAGLRCTAHDLRRSFCSRLAAEGVPLQIAQRLMRHASPTTTAAYYTNVEDVLHQAVAKV